MKKLHSLITAVAVFISCSGMSTPIDPDKESGMASTNPRPIEKVASSSKPHAGIDLNYKQPNNLQVGETIELQLNFIVRPQAKQLSVKLRHHTDLQLIAEPQYEFDTTVSKQHAMILQITALHEGRKNIDISATILVDGRYQSRSFTVPITVGDPASFKAESTSSGYTVDKEHGVVSMPAVESSE